MSKAVTLLTMPSRDRLLLIKVGLLLGAIRLGLWMLPFKVLRDLLARAKAPGKERDRETASVERIISGIKLMSRYIPAANCLTQALTASMLLGRQGHHSCLRIGVLKSDNGELKAHAWVETEGRIVIGKLADLSRYTVLPSTEKIA